MAGLLDAASAARIEKFGEGALFFSELSRVLFSASSIGWVVLATAVSVLAWRSGFLPRWLAKAGFALAAIELIPSAGVASDSGFFGMIGFVGIILWGLWVAAISVVLYQSTPAAAESVPAS